MKTPLIIVGIVIIITLFIPIARSTREPDRFIETYHQDSPEFIVYTDTKTGDQIICRYGGITSSSYACVLEPKR